MSSGESSRGGGSRRAIVGGGCPIEDETGSFSRSALRVSWRRLSLMEKTHPGGLRILFADDEAHLRDLMQMELPRLGHEVTVCPDGASAIRSLEKGSYDAALLDLRMPGMT